MDISRICFFINSFCSESYFTELSKLFPILSRSLRTLLTDFVTVLVSNSLKIAILRLLETSTVTKSVNKVLRDLDNMGNSFDNSVKYDSEQKEFIKKQILDIAQ